jgi:endonuclease-8
MPEGDTVHTVARVMAPDLVGQVVRMIEVDQVVQPWAEGSVATRCEALGKHLVIEVTGAEPHTLRVHLGMKGSWHRYRQGEAWRRLPSGRRVVIQTDAWLFVCFGPKDVEVTHAGSYLRPQVEHLGPDLLGVEFDMVDVLLRARLPSNRRLAIADVLLAQTVASGIGNVYKSELLFLERVDPFAPSSAVADTKLVAIYERARVLMRENLESGGWRITTTRPLHATGFSADRSVPMEQRHWVYRRARKPCHECGTLVRSRLQGPMARMTYWCPRCQA